MTNILRIPSDFWEGFPLMICKCYFITFSVGRGGGGDVGTWLDATPGQIEGGSFGRDFPLNFISSKPDG